MPSKTAKSELTPASTPLQRFQAKDANLKNHQAMVDEDSFNVATDAALAEYVTNLAGGVKDMNTAAAAGFRLESQRLEDHLVRSGMAELVERFKTPRVSSVYVRSGDEREGAGGELADDIESRWLRAAAQLQEMAELEPERKRAVERFNAEATEESWGDAHRLLAPRASPGE